MAYKQPDRCVQRLTECAIKIVPKPEKKAVPRTLFGDLWIIFYDVLAGSLSCKSRQIIDERYLTAYMPGNQYG